MSSIKSNIKLSSDELNELRSGVIAIFSESTGIPKDILKKQFNSNLANYQTLYKDINSDGSLTTIDITSVKPLASLFYFSKNGATPQSSFRKKFIDALYKYAYGKTKDEYFASDGGNSLIKKIEGFWKCYYSKNNKFHERFNSPIGNAPLSIVALTIKSQSIHKGHVEFYQNDNSGSGTVEIDGSNLVFNLRSSRNNEPIYLLMNCGRHISEIPNQIKNAAGLGLYINASANPKAVKCVMEHISSDENTNITNNYEKVLNLSVADKLDDRLSKIISFFDNPHNTTDVGITSFTSVN